MTASIPAKNTFSCTMPENPWLLHQWMPATLFYLAYKSAGIAGLVICKAFLVCILCLIILASARLKSGNSLFWPLLTTTITVLIARTRFFERPFIFSAIFLALLYMLSGKYHLRKKWLWGAMPVFMAVWANIHFGVLYGFALLALFLAGDFLNRLTRIRRQDHAAADVSLSGNGAFTQTVFVFSAGILASIAAIVISVSIINPNGLSVLAAPVRFYLDPFWSHTVNELKPPAGTEAISLIAFTAFLIFLQSVSWRNIDFRLVVVSAGFAVLAFRTQRAVLLFVIVAVPHAVFLLHQLAPLKPRISKRLSFLVMPVLWLLLTFKVIIPDPTLLFGPGLFPKYYPMGVFRFIKKNVPPQNLYNDMMYGGPVIWFLYPDFKPFVDGRGEAYTLDFWKTTYLSATCGDPSWKNIFSNYNIHAALLSSPMASPIRPLAEGLYNDPAWNLVAFDDDTLFFLEETAENKPVIEQFAYKHLKPGVWTLDISKPDAHRVILEAERALSAVPESLLAKTARARANLVSGSYEQALEGYRELISRGGAGGNYLRDYGYCLFMLGYLSEAENVFLELVESGQDDGFASFFLYHINSAKGNTESANMFLEQSMAFQTNNPALQKALINIRH